MLALSFETGGRLSPGGIRTLQTLAADSRVLGKRHFARPLAGFSARVLRGRLESELLRHLADLQLLALDQAVADPACGLGAAWASA